MAAEMREAWAESVGVDQASRRLPFSLKFFFSGAVILNG